MSPIDILKKCRKFVVIGLKNNPEKYVYKIYKRLLNANYEVYAVSNYINEIDGKKVYQNLCDLPVNPEVAVFVVSKKYGYTYLEECKTLQIPYLWLQPGTYDEDFIKKMEEYELNYYLNCILRRLDDLNNSKND